MLIAMATITPNGGGYRAEADGPPYQNGRLPATRALALETLEGLPHAREEITCSICEAVMQVEVRLGQWAAELPLTEGSPFSGSGTPREATHRNYS